MTAKLLLTTLLPLVDDLSRDLPEGERYRRLLHALRTLLPCDAAALLRLDGEWLVPLAVDGLSLDTLGRRFKVSEHPRFQALLASPGPTRFPSNCELPDPYDGLVDGLAEHLEVHDCMGCPLFVEERPWGLLTLDALDSKRFEPVSLDDLQAFASLAAATVNVAQRIERLALRVEDERQKAELYRQANDSPNKELIGQSKVHKRLLEEIALVGGSDLTVLITGETGVGKELVAQAIHAASPRADKPLISLNCAALPDTLVESELFGHVRGAFTGATQDRRGKFELANGGTLFLDEVESMPLNLQIKLLRVLQERTLERLGSNQSIDVDCRVIAATKSDLDQLSKASQFRSDLYYRLNVVTLELPPLRERREDILQLFEYFLQQSSLRFDRTAPELDNQTVSSLMSHDWPGNVRELRNVAERFALGLPAFKKSGSNVAQGLGFSEAVEAFERNLLTDALQRSGGNLTQASQELGMAKTTLFDKVKKYGLTH